MMKHRLPVITRKVVLAVIIAGFILCTAISGVGYYAFNRQFRRQYDEHIRSVAEAARECLNPDDFASYLATGRMNEAYDGILEILQYFVDKFELNLLYVTVVEPPDYTHLTYLYNVVNSSGDLSAFSFGHSEEYVSKSYNESARRVFEDGETVVAHTFSARSGAHITAKVPVYDSRGTVVALLGAQLPVQDFVAAGNSYMRQVLLVELFFAVVFYVLFTLFFSLAFIKPLLLVTHETDRFASYGGEPGDALLAVRNRDEIGTLAQSVHQMERDVRHSMMELEAVTAEKERISTELNVATKIQRDMLPQIYPAFPEREDFDLYATMSPAKEVGGDLYDYLLLDDDHLMLVVGDVSGKGVPAALFMVIAKTLLSSHAVQGLSPKEICEVTNNQLCKGNETGLFVTCWLGILRFSTGELRFVNAGHPYPVLYDAGQGEFSLVQTKPNFALGGIEGLSYTEHAITLHTGDHLFVYTDGVTEATDAHDQLFGEERLLSALHGTENMTAPQTLSAVRSAIDAFVGGSEQFDDITLLDFVWKGAFRRR